MLEETTELVCVCLNVKAFLLYCVKYFTQYIIFVALNPAGRADEGCCCSSSLTHLPSGELLFKKHLKLCVCGT